MDSGLWKDVSCTLGLHGIRYNPFQESSTAPGFAGFVLDITILGAVRMVDQ
jgi:hypothetical protein